MTQDFVKPKLIVFDLDYTLVTPDGALYKNVKRMLEDIKKAGIKIALASYNKDGESILKKNKIRTYFDIVLCESWWSVHDLDFKLGMLSNILQTSTLQPFDVIFYDDHPKNIETASKLGIKAFLTKGDEIYDLYKHTRLAL